jgi:glycerol-3-phosphate acyltransferase PlsY
LGVEQLLESVLLFVAGYLLGSIPAAQLATRWLKRADLRQYGSGTVSASMVWEHIARWAVVPVGLGLGPIVAAAAGLAAAAGHNWSIFLRFLGGRGLSCFLGMWLVLFPWGFPWMLGFLAVGWLLGDSAPFALVGLATMPLFAAWIGGPEIVAPAAGAMLLLTLAKRLEANRRPLPPPGPERRRIILYRFFLDRDIASHAEWIGRRPQEEQAPDSNGPP